MNAKTRKTTGFKTKTRIRAGDMQLTFECTGSNHNAAKAGPTKTTR